MGARELYKEIKEKEMISMINHSFYKFAVIDEMKLEEKIDNDLLKCLIETDFTCFVEFKTVLYMLLHAINSYTKEELLVLDNWDSKMLISRFKYTYAILNEIGYRESILIPKFNRIYYKRDSNGLFYFFKCNARYLCFFDKETTIAINKLITKYSALNTDNRLICKDCDKFNQEIIELLGIKSEQVYENIYTFLLKIS